MKGSMVKKLRSAPETDRSLFKVSAMQYHDTLTKGSY